MFKKTFSIAIILGFLLFSPFFVFGQNSPIVILESDLHDVAPESLIEIRLRATSNQKINAFNIDLEYSPELFVFERAYTGNSFVSFWKSMPLIAEDGRISLIGGSIEPWSGSNGEIVTLVFKARRIGTSSFVVKNAQFALADGLGTKKDASGLNEKVAISYDSQLATSEIPLTAPKIAGINVIKDPETNDPIMVLNSSDAGSIKWLGTRSKKWLFWSDWQRTQLVSPVPKYAWATQIKALGYNGDEMTKTFYRWKVALVKGLVSLASLVLLIILIFILRKSKRKTDFPISIWLVVFFLTSLFLPLNFSYASSLTLGPSAGTFSVGSTFDVQILLDTEGEVVNVLNTKILFSPDILQVVSPTAGKSVISIWTIPPRFDNQQGEIVLQGGIPEGINVEKGLVSTITFRAKKTGNAVLRFSDNTRILLHDGKGTDSFRQSQNAVFNLILPPPAGPIVASQTHPDQNLWYPYSDALLNWSNANLVSGYSYVLNNLPVFTPDNTINSKESSASFKNLESGSHYFHIKALGKGSVWGGVTHFVLNVDADPPAEFPIEVKPGKKTTSKTLFLYFETTDQYSGIDRYEYSIIPLSPSFGKIAEAYHQFFIESNSPEVVELENGKYDVIVKAYDKAGNFQTSEERIRIVSPFVFFATSKWTFLVILILVVGLFLIYKRAKHWHGDIENKHTNKELPDKVKKQIEELKKYKNKYGTLIVLVGLFASFLTFSGTVYAENDAFVNLSTPLVTSISKNVSNTDIFYVGGKTDKAEITVNIYLQDLETGETRSFSAMSNQAGDWFYRHSTFLSTGEYLLWVQASEGEITSPPSSQFEMNVAPTAIQFGSNRLDFETIYLIVIILLLIVLGVMSFSTVHMISNGRRKHKALKKETKEAEESVKRGFAILRRDIEAELAAIKKARPDQEKTEEEKQREEQLMKDLAEVERFVGKEVWDIEKYT